MLQRNKPGTVLGERLLQPQPLLLLPFLQLQLDLSLAQLVVDKGPNRGVTNSVVLLQ